MKKTLFDPVLNSFQINPKDLSLCKETIFAPISKKEQILSNIQFFRKKYGLGLVLKILYLQQLNSGFILSNPTNYSVPGKQKSFFDPVTGIQFLAQWNPERALRKNHKILIKRGIIQENVDEKKLINKNKNGIPCYLCKRNIDLQNPKEIVLPLKLDGEQFYIGANFASISDNHFTIFNQKHHPQKYRKKIITIMMDFLHQSSDNFRIIYNGLAGASIEVHEHFQTTSICFPVESICYNHQDILFAGKNLRIIKPKYYLPLWVIEGNEQSKMVSILDHLIKKWHSKKPDKYTENILAVKKGSLFRFYVFLRERNKLKIMEHVSALASFEVAGLFVFSDFLKKGVGGKSEKDFFSSLTLDIITDMLKKIAPNDNLTLDPNIDLEDI